jgi:hypothetical protein
VDDSFHPSPEVGRICRVSLRLRGAAVHPEARPDAVDSSASPLAARQRRARGRDPRLWLGVVLVLGSIVVGARLLAAADDTTAVWQVGRDIPAGDAVVAADLQVTRAHFDDPAVAARYVLADRPVDPRSRATRDLHAGELLDASAVSSSPAPPTRQLPLGVGATQQPADLRPGDHVEVWAVPDSSTGAGSGGRVPSLVLRDVRVLSVGGGVVGASAERQVLVGLARTTDVGAVLRLITGASVVLVRLES